MPWPRQGRRSPKRRTGNADELSSVSLGEDFIREARIIELSAEQRAAKRRRDELRQRMVEEGRRETWDEAPSSGRATLRRRVPKVTAAVLLLSLLGWLAAQNGHILQRSASRPVPTDAGAAAIAFDEEIVDLPPPSKEQASAPLGRPARLAVPSDRFAFMRVRPGSNVPVAYDPCRPVHVVVNARTASPKGAAILNEAFDSLRRATGLVFVVDGPTDETPNPKRPSYQPDRYPERWAPVLVAWSDPVESPTLAGNVAGTGGSMALGGDHHVYVTGAVTLDGPQIAEILDGRDGKARARAVILHELGHLVGLDHVPYTTELMSPQRDRDQVSYGAGDLSGLALLGQGECFPTV